MFPESERPGPCSADLAGPRLGLRAGQERCQRLSKRGEAIVVAVRPSARLNYSVAATADDPVSRTHGVVRPGSFRSAPRTVVRVQGPARFWLCAGASPAFGPRQALHGCRNLMPRVQKYRHATRSLCAFDGTAIKKPDATIVAC